MLRYRIYGVRALISRVNRRFLFLAIVLFAGFAITVFKAATAFGPRDLGPDYERAPAPGLAPPVATGLIDPTYIGNASGESGETRLPDEDYTFLIATAKRIAPLAIRAQLKPAELSADGMSQRSANEDSATLAAVAKTYAGYQAGLDNEYQLTLTNAQTATVSVGVTYQAEGVPAISGQLQLSYNSLSGKWRLDRIALQVASSEGVADQNAGTTP